MNPTWEQIVIAVLGASAAGVGGRIAMRIITLIKDAASLIHDAASAIAALEKADAELDARVAALEEKTGSMR